MILLPWAGLPFMLGLTIVALRRGGWREPALFAIVVALVSGINATSIIYVGVVPILWLLYAVVVLREATWRRALGTAVRIGLLTLGACVWWMAGLEVEAAYGVNVLKYTETVPSTSATSNAADILRGLGYWYFYGTDHLGPWTNAAVRYTQNITLLATSFAVPVLARARRGVRALARAGLLPRHPLRRGRAGRRAVPLLRPDRAGRLAEVVHDRHDGGTGPALHRPGHPGRAAGPGHPPGQRAHRARGAASASSASPRRW